MSVQIPLVEQIRRLDLSGGPSSWFDLWHIHPYEKGNAQSTRAENIDVLLHTYDALKQAITPALGAYQLFVVIDEGRCDENAVYLHTKNPNGSPFPLELSTIRPVSLRSDLMDPMLRRGWRIITVETEDGLIHYAFDPAVGLPLV